MTSTVLYLIGGVILYATAGVTGNLPLMFASAFFVIGSLYALVGE